MYRMGLDGLGCASGDCADGTASVNEMDAIYSKLDSSTQSRFQETHDGIMASYQSQIPPWWLQGFNPACCAVRDLGVQAQDLLNKIAAATGQQSTGVGPSTPGSDFSLFPSLFGTVPTTVLVLGGLVIGFIFLKPYLK